MNTEKDQKDQELNLDDLDRVSGGTNSDHTGANKDAIKKVMEQQAETFRPIRTIG